MRRLAWAITALAMMQAGPALLADRPSRSGGTAALPAPGPSSHVIIISIDGLRPDAIDEAQAATLSKWIAGGAYCPSARTISPANTLPAHASMVTGVSPRRHRMAHDDLQPEKGLTAVDTIFRIAKRAGLTTAMIYSKDKFKHLELPGSLDVSVRSGWSAASIMKRTRALIQGGCPDLMLLALPDLDSAGHLNGWMSPEYIAAVGKIDRSLADLQSWLDQAGILRETTILVTSDHGGEGKRHGGGGATHMTIPWLAWGHGVRAGASLSGVSVKDTAAAALFALGLDVPASFEGRVPAGAFLSPVRPAPVRSGPASPRSEVLEER